MFEDNYVGTNISYIFIKKTINLNYKNSISYNNQEKLIFNIGSVLLCLIISMSKKKKKNRETNTDVHLPWFSSTNN